MSWPQVGVGAIVTHRGKVLLVRRARAPSAGEWAIPGGKVNPGESLRAAAEREILEETGVTIRAGAVVFTFEHIERGEQGELRYHYVVLDVAGEYLAGEPQAGDDAAEARWVGLDELHDLPVNATTQRALRELFPLGFGGREP